MKKLISIIATVAIVLSMGVTALAAGSEVAKKDSDVKVTDDKGTPVDAYVPELSGDAVVDLEAKTAGYDTKELVEVTGAGTFAFAFDGAGNVKKVLAYNGSAWEELAFTVDGNKITVTVKGAGTVAFLVDEAKAAEPAKKDEGKASAQTGYNSAAYIVCAVVLAAGAAFFFGTSKKSVKEM